LKHPLSTAIPHHTQRQNTCQSWCSPVLGDVVGASASLGSGHRAVRAGSSSCKHTHTRRCHKRILTTGTCLWDQRTTRMPGRLHHRQPTLHSPQAWHSAVNNSPLLISHDRTGGQKHLHSILCKTPSSRTAQRFQNRNSRSILRRCVTAHTSPYQRHARDWWQRYQNRCIRRSMLSPTSQSQRQARHRGFST
jgi:hypothetical protein